MFDPSSETNCSYCFPKRSFNFLSETGSVPDPVLIASLDWEKPFCPFGCATPACGCATPACGCAMPACGCATPACGCATPACAIGGFSSLI